MLRTMARSLILLFLLFSALFPINDGVQILNSSNTGMLVEFNPIAWSETEMTDNQKSMQRKSFADCQYDVTPGDPALPFKIITVGVPEGAAISVNVVDSDFVLETDVDVQPLPEQQRTESGIENIYSQNSSYQKSGFAPQNIVSVHAVQSFRQYRIAKIKISPVQYDPLKKQVRQYNSIRFQISFSGGTQPTNKVSHVEKDAFAPKLLLNYEQAKNWRATPVVSLAKSGMVMDGENWYKIVINGNGAGGKEGIYKVTGKALKDAGINLSSVDISTLQLFNNGGKMIPDEIKDVEQDTLVENPIYISGTQDGDLDESDYILFYGRSLEGVEFDKNAGEYQHYINAFSYENVYWLTFNQQTGKRMPMLNSQSVSGLNPETSFRDMVWLEEERYNIFNSGKIWLGHELTPDNQGNSYSTSFNLKNVVMSDSARIKVSLASTSSNMHYFTLYANGNQVGSYSQYGGEATYRLRQASFQDAGVLLNGSNSISISYSAGESISFSYVDYIELEYSKEFIAHDDMLIFNAPLKDGISRFQISGFSNDNIRIYDVTDISNISQISGAQISGGVVDFAVQCSSLFPKRFIAVTTDNFKEISLPDDAKTTVQNLRVQKDVDYIIITHRNFYQQAQTLKSLREDWSAKERYKTEIVDYQDVINQFGCGIADPGAIRGFLAFALENWGNPAYVLLIGDGHFDYRDILKYGRENMIVTYQTDGNDESNTRTTDDWFTYTKGSSAGMQMSIGRLPVQTIEEARNIIDKIVAYETEPEYGEWLKTITVVGDDDLVAGGQTQDGAMHTNQADNLAELYVPDMLDVKKIYLFDHQAVSNPSVAGVSKPTATLALLDQINRGSLIINYVGHGNDELWSHERILLRSRDYDAIQNGNRTALWIAATCEFAHWDQANEQSFAEDILFMQARGAVGMISSARLAFVNSNARFNYSFYEYLFADYEQTGLTATLGEAMLQIKANGSNSANDEKYAIFGDPVMRLCAPRYHAVVDSIAPDSIQALAKMKITGHIEKNNAWWSDYNGSLLVRVMDTRKKVEHQIPNNYSDTFTKVDYMIEGNTLFRGVTPIENGQFSVELIIPKDISYGGDEGAISIYFNNASTSGTGVVKDLVVGGTAVNLVDNEGPEMQLNFGDANYQDGDFVSTNPILHLEIGDSLSGINTAGDLGHQIMLTVDAAFDSSVDITEYFTYSEGSYTSGTLDYPIYDMKIGEHDLQVKAWDNSNNSSIIETHFIVLDDSELEIRELLSFPNPMTDECTFRFQLSQNANINIKLYTVAGRMVKKFEPFYATAGYTIAPEIWDGRDDAGDRLANGVYLYKVSAKAENDGKQVTAEKIGKVIIAN